MRYMITRGQYGMAFFLDTGEKFYKKQPYPVDHIFDTPLILGFPGVENHKKLCCNISRHISKWANTLSPELHNEFFTMMVRINRTILYGEPSLVDEEDTETEINWGIRKNGHTKVSLIIQDLIDELNCIFGGPVGLLHNIQKFLLREIADNKIAHEIIEHDVLDRSIPFKDEQLIQLATLMFFLKIMTPITGQYHFHLVSSHGPIPRPWVVLHVLYEEALSQYCPSLMKQLTKVVAAHVEVTRPKSTHTAETQLQLKEYLFLAGAMINIYSKQVNMVDNIYGIFKGNR